MRLLASTLARLALATSALASTGCQFLFPTPIDAEAEVAAPSRAVRVVGPAYGEGETLVAEVQVDGVVAGRGVLEVGRRCLADGKAALPVRSDAGSEGLLAIFGDAEEQSVGLLDLDTSTPLEAAYDVTLGDLKTFVELDYVAGGYRFHQIKRDGDKKPKIIHKKVVLPTEQAPHDAHSVLGYLRRWEPPEGTRGHLFALIGRNLYRLDLVFVGQETIPTARGPVATHRIDGVATRISDRTLKPTKAAPRPFSLWVGDDEERVPQRVLVESDLAKLTLELVKHDVEPYADGPLEPCKVRVDKGELAKAKAPKKDEPKGAVADATRDDEESEVAKRLRLRLLKLPPKRTKAPPPSGPTSPDPTGPALPAPPPPPDGADPVAPPR